MIPTSHPLVQLSDGPSRLIVACYENVGVAHWWNAPTVKMMRTLTDELRRMAARHGPARTAFANVIHGGKPDFPSGLRESVVESILDAAMPHLCTAHLVSMSGFAGAATRAFLSTVLLVARSGPPARVFSEPQATAAWLASLLAGGPVPWTAVDLQSALSPPPALQ